MGCGASKDCVPEQPRPNKTSHSTLSACRNRLHVVIADIACKNVAVASSPHEYTQLGSGEDDGTIGEELSVSEQAEATRTDLDDGQDVLSDFYDELESQENKPPPYQLLTVHQQAADSAVNLNPAMNQSKKDPLRELSISHDGKLVDHDLVKDNQFDFSSVYALSPRKQNNNQSYGGLSPSLWPSKKTKANSLSSPRYSRENSTPLSPVSEPRSLKNVGFVHGTDALSPTGKLDESHDTDLSPRRRANEIDRIGSVDRSAPNLKDLEEILKSEMSIMNIDEFIENIAADCEERKKLHDQLTTDHNLSTSPIANTYMKELLEHFDKSTEPLHMPPITPRLDAWQSKLLETIDKDIDMLLNDEVEASSSLGEDDGDLELHGKLQTNNRHTRFESIEL